jgi:hypothetical protein
MKVDIERKGGHSVCHTFVPWILSLFVRNRMYEKRCDRVIISFFPFVFLGLNVYRIMLLLLLRPSHRRDRLQNP